MRPVSAPIDLDDRSKPQARPRESRFFIQAPSADGAGCASLSTKVLGAKQRANVDIRIGEHRIRALLHPLDGVLDRLHLPEPVAGDDFLGLGKWAVAHFPIITSAARRPVTARNS